MKIIVFGGAGFLGSHVCDKLSDAGYEVVVFDKTESPWIKNDQEMIIGDILDKDCVEKAIEGAKYIFNFAGLADIDEAKSRPVETIQYNILGNAVILNACVKYNIKRYIFASTVYVYSKSGGFYRCSKQSCESYIEEYYHSFNQEYTILRFGSLYGPRAKENNAIYSFVKQAIKDNKIIYSSGSQDALREYIHVEDAAKSCVEILKPEYNNQHIILTGHQPMRVGDLFKMISEILGKNIEIVVNPDNSSIHYEITPYSFIPKTGQKLTPQTHIDLGQGLLRIVEDFYNVYQAE